MIKDEHHGKGGSYVRDASGKRMTLAEFENAKRAEQQKPKTFGEVPKDDKPASKKDNDK